MVRSRPTTLYVFSECTVAVDEDRRILTTVFPDGTGVHAAPGTGAADVQRAHDLGYDGDTWAMSRDHELSHTWLAHTHGLRWSPTLWRVAHPEALGAVGDREVGEEERRVLVFQRSLASAPGRPWDPLRAPGAAAMRRASPAPEPPPGARQRLVLPWPEPAGRRRARLGRGS